MRVASQAGADHRSVNEVFGFVARLAMLSAAHTTDYVVDAGTVAMIGGPNVDILIKICAKVGLLAKVKIDGEIAYKVIDDPDFLHLRLKAEIEWERQQLADTRNPALAVPVRHRDGDLCRYCGVCVMWQGRPSKRSGTLDHLNPGQPGTVATMVVACRSCNSELRDMGGQERDQLQPEPIKPYYSEYTAGWLTDNGRPTAASPRPGNQPEHAPRTARTTKKGLRADSQPANAPTGDSDPSTDGHRASASQESDIKPTSNRLSQDIGTSSAGQGRDGSGTLPLSSGDNAGTGRRRKRSPRGNRRNRPPQQGAAPDD
jgi:5-methylcytosine-specific restriction endonuclease McrA